MLQHQPTLQVLQHIVRTRVCGHCDSPQRTPVHGPDATRGCEADCPIFQVLPQLHEVMVCMDPSLRAYDQTLAHAVEHAHERMFGGRHAHHRCPLCKHSRALVNAICEAIH